MTAGGFDCDAVRTEQIAAALRTATAPLNGVAGRMPEPPLAGEATGAVIGFMQRLAEAMAELAESTQATGQQVTEAVDTYRRDDAGAAGHVRRVPMPDPPR